MAVYGSAGGVEWAVRSDVERGLAASSIIFVSKSFPFLKEVSVSAAKVALLVSSERVAINRERFAANDVQNPNLLVRYSVQRSA